MVKPKLKNFRNSLLIVSTLLLLSACEEPVITEVVEPEAVTYSSVLDYMDTNKIDVKTVEQVQEDLKDDYPWFKKDNLGVVRILHDVHFGLETMELVKLEDTIILKLNGTVYNQNNKDVVRKIFKDIKTYSDFGLIANSDNTDLLLEKKVIPNEHEITNDNVFKANSETPFSLYLTIPSTPLNGFYYYDGIKLLILKQELEITKLKHYSDLTEEERAIVQLFNKKIGIEFNAETKFK